MSFWKTFLTVLLDRPVASVLLLEVIPQHSNLAPGTFRQVLDPHRLRLGVGPNDVLHLSLLKRTTQSRPETSLPQAPLGACWRLPFGWMVSESSRMQQDPKPNERATHHLKLVLLGYLNCPQHTQLAQRSDPRIHLLLSILELSIEQLHP